MNRTHGQGLLRRRPMLSVLAGILLVAAAAVRAADVPGPIDWNRARELNQQKQQGQTLSPEDQAYLDRALALRQSGGGAQTAARELNVPFLGEIPLNTKVRIFGDAGQPERILADTDDYVSRAINRVVANTAARVSIMTGRAAPAGLT